MAAFRWRMALNWEDMSVLIAHKRRVFNYLNFKDTFLLILFILEERERLMPDVWRQGNQNGETKRTRIKEERESFLERYAFPLEALRMPEVAPLVCLTVYLGLSLIGSIWAIFEWPVCRPYASSSWERRPTMTFGLRTGRQPFGKLERCISQIILALQTIENIF